MEGERKIEREVAWGKEKRREEKEEVKEKEEEKRKGESRKNNMGERAQKKKR